jgi:hypothetical protein
MIYRFHIFIKKNHLFHYLVLFLTKKKNRVFIRKDDLSLSNLEIYNLQSQIS